MARIAQEMMETQKITEPGAGSGSLLEDRTGELCLEAASLASVVFSLPLLPCILANSCNLDPPGLSSWKLLQETFGGSAS